MNDTEDHKQQRGWTSIPLNNELGVYAIVILLIGVGLLASPEFLTQDNLVSVLNAVALLGIVSVGVAFVTYSGNLADLSVPAIMALAGVVTVECLPFGFVPALVLGLLSGILVGIANGIVVGHFNANGILWTLAMAFAVRGALRFFQSNNMAYPGESPGSAGELFVQLYRMDVGPVPIVVIVMFLLFIAGHVLMKRTRFGLQCRYTGASRSAARHSGMGVEWTTLGVFVASAFTSSIGGILLSSMNKYGVYHLGTGYDFQTVTAVVLGGITLSGGRGSMLGLFGGVMVIGLLRNIMTFFGVGTFSQKIVTGLVFILVVGANRWLLEAGGGGEDV